MWREKGHRRCFTLGISQRCTPLNAPYMISDAIPGSHNAQSSVHTLLQTLLLLELGDVSFSTIHNPLLGLPRSVLRTSSIADPLNQVLILGSRSLLGGALHLATLQDFEYPVGLQSSRNTTTALVLPEAQDHLFVYILDGKFRDETGCAAGELNT